MKLNYQIKLLTSALLVLAVFSIAGLFLTTQYREKKDLMIDLLSQKNHLMATAAGTAKTAPELEHLLTPQLKVPDWSWSAVIDLQGNPLFKQQSPLRIDLEQILEQTIVRQALSAGSSEGVVEVLNDKDERLFMGYYPLADKAGFILSFAPFRLVQNTMTYQGLYAIFIILFILGVGLLALNFTLDRLTSDLENLSAVVARFGSGDLEVRCDTKTSSEETSRLGTSFNLMADKIKNLFTIQEKKVSLDAEINTARRVQDSFFPPLSVDDKHFSLRGFYEAAQGCGGDWLHYYSQGEIFYLCIGDVTGHGLPSALLTATSHAAFSVFEDEANSYPAETMRKLNKVIFKATGGKLHMTFLMARINLRTGHMTYTNASHTPPLLVQRGDLSSGGELLLDIHGKRLGEDLDATYSETEYNLKKDQILFLYTDGIFDLKTKNGSFFNDRKLMRTLNKLVQQHELAGVQVAFEREIRNLKGTTALVDDLSWMFLQVRSEQN
jgi:serine phosphatase RsbU (regulator of sigma subunit)/HAMP domain-containing protein